MNKSRKGTMARLMEYITARHKREFALVIICILISVVAAMVGNSLMQVIIDDYILEMVETGEDLFGGLLRIVLVMAAVYLAGALGTLFYNRVIAIVGQKVLKEIRDDLFVKMQTFPISFFDSHTHGDIMSVYTNDTDTLRQFIAQSLPMMISSLVTILFAFCFMLRFNLILTAIVAALSAVMVLTARAMVRYSSKRYLWVQGFCDETCTKGCIMTRFLRRPISKFLARISLDAALFFSLQALFPEQIIEVKQWKIMKSVRCRKRELTP